MAGPIAWNCECGEPNSGRLGQLLACKKCGKVWGSKLMEALSSSVDPLPTSLHGLVRVQVAELDQIIREGGDFDLVGERIKRWKRRAVAALRSGGLGPEGAELEELEPGSAQMGNPEGNRARRVNLYRAHLLALAEELERYPTQSMPDVVVEGQPHAQTASHGARSLRRDFFISHATEDKVEIAKPIADALIAAGYGVWFDEYELVVGDRLRRKIDEGLSVSEVGVVVLSRHFFSKEWPQRELDGLVALQKRVLPIWHQVTRAAVASYSPTLADVFALDSGIGPAQIATDLIKALRKAAREDSTSESEASLTGLDKLMSSPGYAEAGLSAEAVEILIAAAGDGDIVRFSADQSGDWVRAGGRHFSDSSDPAVAAVYLEALEDLHQRRLARRESETSYSLTGTGFKLARALKNSLAKTKRSE